MTGLPYSPLIADDLVRAVVAAIAKARAEAPNDQDIEITWDAEARAAIAVVKGWKR